jgi:hypothetical protein
VFCLQLGHAEVVACLLSSYGLSCGYMSGSSCEMKFIAMPDSEGRSAVCRAARGGHLEVVRLLIPAYIRNMAPWYARKIRYLIIIF